ncbi:MAG: deoxyhypusine synthase family protein, partial [Thermoplasmata archaeon]
QVGGLSGATLDEAVSWGKIKDGSQRTIVYSDATLALPMIVTYVLAKKSTKEKVKKSKRIKIVAHAR